MKIKLQQAEESFGPDQARDCDLLLAIDRERISFAVLNSGHQLLALTEILCGPEGLEDIYNTFPLLGYPYRSVRIAVETRKFTFIPEEVFSDDQRKAYSRFVKPHSPSDVLFTDLPGFGIRNLVAVESAFQETLRSRFPGAIITSQVDPFLCGIARQLPEETPSWHFNLGSRSFEAALVRDGRLQFCNIFEAAGPDDFNYFILLLLREFPETADSKAVISGSIGMGDPLHARLKKYIRQIETADTSWVQQSGTFARVPLYHYFNLLNLAVCG